MSVPSITVDCGPDLLALTPYLTRQHPADSVVLLLFTRDAGQLVTASYPLAPGIAPLSLLGQVHETLTQVQPVSVAIAAYGPLSTRPALAQLIAHTARRVPVRAAFLAAQGRSYCLTCPCAEATDGIPFDPTITSAACEATLASLAAPPPPRHPATPDPRLQARTAAALTSTVMPTHPVAAYRELIDALADGVPVTPQRVARLAVVLTDLDVRDLALREVMRWPSPLPMWLNIVTHLPDAYLPTSGDLAAVVAWKTGDHTLALALFTRVLAVQPGDQMAGFLAEAVGLGVPFDYAYRTVFGDRGQRGR